MTQRDNRVYAAIMRDAARDAVRLAGASREEFLAKETWYMAASFHIERLARFAGRTAQWFRDEHPEIDWDRVAQYGERVEPDPPEHDPVEAWTIVAGELPALAAKLDALLPAEEPWCGSAPPGREARGLNPEVEGEAHWLGAPQVAVPHEALAELCHRWKIARVRLYGSAVRDDCTPQSDVDVLIDLPPDERLGRRLFDLQEEVAALFADREVDVVDSRRLNKYFREQILATAVEIYPSGRADTD